MKTALACETCGVPGVELCAECHLSVTDPACRGARYVHHDCPDCLGHESVHSESYVACPDHAQTRAGLLR